MGIAIKNFGGMVKRTDPSLLPDNMACHSLNVDYLAGTLKPLKQQSTVYMNSGNTLKNLYWTNAGRIVGFREDIYWAKEATKGYGKEWVYVTGWTGQPPLRASMTEFVLSINNDPFAIISLASFTTLGIPAPTVPLVVETRGEGNGVAMARAYVWTWLTQYGEESAPSPPSNIIDVKPGQSAWITLTPNLPPAGVTNMRIYRTDATGNYRFLAEIIYGTAWEGGDDRADYLLGEILQTEGWFPPPSALSGLKSGPNGTYAGFFNNTVAFSQPYAPYAWPIDFQYNVDYPIVAVQANSGGWLILTTGTPYFIYGSNPANMTMAKVNVNQACIAPRSVVDMGEYVLYASPDGLIAARGMDFQVISKKVWTRDQWMALVPSTMVGCAYQGRYIGFVADQTQNSSFIYYPEDNYFTYATVSASTYVVHLASDSLYLYHFNRDRVELWGGGNALSMAWFSKRFTFPMSINLGAALVDAAAYPVGFGIYLDESPSTFSVSSTTPSVFVVVTSRKPFKLPAGYLGNSFRILLSGANEIYGLYIGQDIDELMELM